MAEDIISALPNDILCHILSFLETKHAIATTVLSKRWNNLCFSVPVLHLNTIITDQNTYLRFIYFVYSVLLSRNPLFPIKTLFLVFSYDDYIDNQIVHPHSPMETITKWINFVVQRGVENLDLHIELGEEVGFTKLPISILTCNTLVVLNLHCFSLEDTSFLAVSLPSLKTLSFNNALFSKLRDLILFLNGCPILEDLFIFNMLFDSEESLTRDEWKSFRLSNLIRASNIDCFHSYFPLKAIHNVHSLRLQINQELYGNDLIPTFHNLTYLELVCLDYGWQFLIKILNHCPKLQELKIDQAPISKKTWTKKDDKENWVDPDAVPQCLSLNLKTCTLFNFLGLQGEVKLAKYILKNARVLQTMDIVNDGQAKINRLISSCPRASATCKLRVYVLVEE